MSTYSMTVAGLQRELPICKVTDDLYIGAFICFGDAELTEACGRELLKLLEPGSYDYLFTAEAKSIPLIHEMARQSGAKKYFIARKGPKAYMPDPIHVEDQSITTAGTQKLYLGRDDADLIRGKRIVLMDDVISTGGSLKAMEDHEMRLLRMAEEGLRDIGHITIYGTSEHKGPVLSFLVDGQHPYDVGVLLDQMGIAVRTGHHCAQPLMERLGIPGTVRASFAVYNTEAEVESFLKAMKRIVTMLHADR